MNSEELNTFLKDRHFVHDDVLNCWFDDGDPCIVLEPVSWLEDISPVTRFDLSVTKFVGDQPIRIAVYNSTLKNLIQNYDKYTNRLVNAWRCL